MKISILLCIVLFGITHMISAQNPSLKNEGEIGISIGPSHYFGDLNTRSRVNTLNGSVGFFVRKPFGEYIAGRLSLNYAKFGYSDKYNTSNQYQRARNLNFQTNIFELTAQGDFNFFKYIPQVEGYKFTPYVTLGVGIFSFDPYTYLNGQKYYLRPLGTEGQGTLGRKKPYKTIAMCVPLGVGFKFALNSKFNLAFEVSHRFTTTDYLDDVSTTYAGPDAFANSSGAFNPALLLQDRSYEIMGTPIGIKDRQRGYSKQKDQYIFAQIMLSINLTSYQCPNPY